jgi:SPP1 family predicted phage head-tail adaptor
MNIGELNCRVTIQKLTETRDDEGNIVPSYKTRTTVWAKVEAITARVRDSYMEQNYEILHRITVRYDPAMLKTDRIVYGKRTFTQIGPPVNVGERNAFLRLECRELVEAAHG